MDRAQILQSLTEHKPVLARRFGVIRLALFGSTARDSAPSGRDIDILVAFYGPATSQRCFGVQLKALRAELRPYIEREAVHV